MIGGGDDGGGGVDDCLSAPPRAHHKTNHMHDEAPPRKNKQKTSIGKKSTKAPCVVAVRSRFFTRVVEKCKN